MTPRAHIMSGLSWINGSGVRWRPGTTGVAFRTDATRHG